MAEARRTTKKPAAAPRPAARRRARSSTATKAAPKQPVDIDLTASDGVGSASAPVIRAGDAMAAPFAPPAGARAALNADITNELAAVAPTFADVLTSVGLGVASSQTALDKGVVETVKALSEKKVTIVTDVITELNDEGQPIVDAADPEKNLRKETVSVLNFFTPTVHEWKHVALSMDLQVGAIDNDHGFRFSQSQASVSAGGTYLWGFMGWFSVEGRASSRTVKSESSQEANWSQGSVRVDALLAPRRTERFPVPGSFKNGLQLNVSQGATTPEANGRSTILLVELRKASGEPNPNKALQVSAPGLLPTAMPVQGAAGPGTLTTNNDGRIQVKLTRTMANPTLAQPATFTVTFTLGQFSRAFEISL